MSMMSPYSYNPGYQYTGGSGAPQATSNTVQGGIYVGNTFDGKSNDFLSPDNILGNVNDFSNSISPITSNTPTGQISYNPYGKNANPGSILGSTNSMINSIKSASFGSNINYQVPIFQGGNFIQPVPDLGTNPDPVRILLSTTFFQNGITAPNPQYDPRNYNPLQWHNPNPTNILAGTTGAYSTLLGGGSLNFPPFSPFPGSPPVTSFPPFPNAMSAMGTPITVWPSAGQTVYGPYIPNNTQMEPYGNSSPGFNYPFPYSFARPVQAPAPQPIPIYPPPVVVVPRPICPPPVPICPPPTYACLPKPSCSSLPLGDQSSLFSSLSSLSNALTSLMNKLAPSST